MSRAINVLLVEDDPTHRTQITQGLGKFGCVVRAFKDVATLAKADKKGFSEFSGKGRRVIILDIMLAFDLRDEDGPAIPWREDGPPTAEEAKYYVDDDLGMKLAWDIRNGAYKHVPSDIPILFLTARANEMIIEEIEQLSKGGRAKYLGKPAFSDEIHEALRDLLAPDKHAGKGRRNE